MAFGFVGVNRRSKKLGSPFRTRASVSPIVAGGDRTARARETMKEEEFGLSFEASSSALGSEQSRAEIPAENATESTSLVGSSAAAPKPTENLPQNFHYTTQNTSFCDLSTLSKRKSEESASKSESILSACFAKAAATTSPGTETSSSTSIGSRQQKSFDSPLYPMEDAKHYQVSRSDLGETNNQFETAAANEQLALDLSALRLRDDHSKGKRSNGGTPLGIQCLPNGGVEDGVVGGGVSAMEEKVIDPILAQIARRDSNTPFSQSSTPSSCADRQKLYLGAMNLREHMRATKNQECVTDNNSVGGLDELILGQLDDSRGSPGNSSLEASFNASTQNSKFTPPTSLNGTPVNIFASQGPAIDEALQLPPQASLEHSVLPSSSENTLASATNGSSSLKLYSAIGSLEDPLSSSYKLSNPKMLRRKQDFPSALRKKTSSKQAPSVRSILSEPKKAVTVTEPPKKTRKELFRPSSDAYTPRMGKRKIEYKPAEERTPVMTSNMGTLSRPNFSDALRRVAMILRQHIVKIEGRFEDGWYQKDRLFSKSMKNVFCEANFVTPRYRCTMIRVPMARSGMACGMKRIEETYEIPSENEIYTFAHQLFQTVQLSSECSIVSLIYVERMMELAKVPLLASTWRPIFMAGLLLASKVWQDLNSWNVEFANVYPRFSLDSINKLEMQFLRMIKWDLYISSTLYAKYYFALRSLVDKKDFRQRYNRMVGGVDNVRSDRARHIEARTTAIKEDAISQLSRSM